MGRVFGNSLNVDEPAELINFDSYKPMEQIGVEMEVSSMEDLDKSISHLKRNKVPSLDSITPEMLKDGVVKSGHVCYVYASWSGRKSRHLRNGAKALSCLYHRKVIITYCNNQGITLIDTGGKVFFHNYYVDESKRCSGYANEKKTGRVQESHWKMSWPANTVPYQLNWFQSYLWLCTAHLYGRFLITVESQRRLLTLSKALTAIPSVPWGVRGPFFFFWKRMFTPTHLLKNTQKLQKKYKKKKLPDWSSNQIEENTSFLC